MKKNELINLIKGTWFYFDEENEDEGGVCIRLISNDELDRIIIFYKLTGIEKPIVKKKIEELIWDYVITDWKNVLVSGTEVDCTKENKVKLMKDPDFANFIVKSLEILLDDIESGNYQSKNKRNK